MSICPRVSYLCESDRSIIPPRAVAPTLRPEGIPIRGDFDTKAQLCVTRHRWLSLMVLLLLTMGAHPYEKINHCLSITPARLWVVFRSLRCRGPALFSFFGKRRGLASLCADWAPSARAFLNTPNLIIGLPWARAHPPITLFYHAFLNRRHKFTEINLVRNVIRGGL